MGHPIIDKIVKDGVQSVNVSMLSPELRFKLMTEAGNVLMHMARYPEAAKAFATADNREQLREHGKWFLEQQKVGLAAYFLLHVEREEQLEELAQRCIAANEIAPAEAIYAHLNDKVMLSFLRENFKEELRQAKSF
jgi:hypothetical protein